MMNVRLTHYFGDRVFFLLAEVLMATVLIAGGVAGCAAKHTVGDPVLEPAALATNPLPPEEAQELLGEMGNNWLYGHGVGETALTIGAIVAFPPYAIYVAGNSLLEIGGYDQLRFSDALPEEERDHWNHFYDSVTAGPGRVSAAVAGREFRTRERARAVVEPYVKRATEKAN